MSELESLSASDLLKWALESYGQEFAISTSFQKEGMVIVDMASRAGIPFRVFTLDTGRLPQETHQMIDAVRERYRVPVEVVVPDAAEVQAMVGQYGTNLFYNSVELRQMCCDVRKVRPLQRKLQGLKAWAAGLRRSQGDTRARVPKAEEVDGRVKLSPLADWTAAQVEDYTQANGVLVHPLYAAGYTSIGCGPCTRAVQAGESERAGRWWWEQDAHKECGIHFGPDGAVKRRSATKHA